MSVHKWLRTRFNVRKHISAHVFMSIFFSVLIISTILISAYSFIAMNNITTVNIQNGENVVDTIFHQIDTYVENIAQTHTLMLSSENLYPFLYTEKESMPSYEWFENYQGAYNMLRFCGRSQLNLISGMIIFKSSGETMQYGSFNAVPDIFALREGALKRLYIYRGHPYYISAISVGTSEEEPDTYLMTQIQDDAFDDLCRGLLMADSSLVLLDEEGNIFRHYAGEDASLGHLEAYLENRVTGKSAKGLHYIEAYSDANGLTVAMILPSLHFSEMIFEIVPWLIPALAFALMAGFVLSFGLSRKVITGFEIMENNIRLVNNRAYDDVKIIPSQDEFGHMSRTFARMAAHIHTLIRENQERERAQHMLEIQVLRAQISPHFLSNALNNVRRLAAMQGMENIEQLTAAIIHLLRAALSNTEALIPLRQEMNYVRNYCAICQYQYLDDFTLDVQIDESLMNCYLPPMVLQPIVENALTHGIADCPGAGEIRIQGRKDGDMLILTVHDNGQGMSGDQIDALLRQAYNTDKRRFSGIGLYNVRKRIEMRFGKQYGLNILSEQGAYTDVELYLPCLTEEIQT